MKSLARIISVLMHPLFFPTYGTVLIVALNPHAYGYFGERLHTAWLIIVFALTALFPIIWLGMMKRLEMIESFDLSTSKERIVPFIATSTFYLWATWMFKPSANMKIPPNEMVFYMMLGATLAVFLAFFINIFSKISLHAIAAGSLFGLLLTQLQHTVYDIRLLLLAAIVLAGLSGTSRLILKAHTPVQVYSGYAVGFVSQFMAFSILPNFF